MKVTALIPVKGFRNAKQRLSAFLGSAEERRAFRLQLVEYFERHREALDDDSLRTG